MFNGTNKEIFHFSPGLSATSIACVRVSLIPGITSDSFCHILHRLGSVLLNLQLLVSIKQPFILNFYSRQGAHLVKMLLENKTQAQTACLLLQILMCSQSCTCENLHSGTNIYRFYFSLGMGDVKFVKMLVLQSVVLIMWLVFSLGLSSLPTPTSQS